MGFLAALLPAVLGAGATLIASNSASKGAQASASDAANQQAQLAQQTFQQQTAYADQKEQALRNAILGMSGQNPYLAAGSKLQRPTQQLPPMSGNMGGQRFGGGSGTAQMDPITLLKQLLTRAQGQSGDSSSGYIPGTFAQQQPGQKYTGSNWGEPRNLNVDGGSAQPHPPQPSQQWQQAPQGVINNSLAPVLNTLFGGSQGPTSTQPPFGGSLPSSTAPSFADNAGAAALPLQQPGRRLPGFIAPPNPFLSTGAA